jgi:hypothetical protein
MHCQDCENLLIDLAYGELDEARAAEVQEHFEGCASCGAAWAKIRGGRAAANWLPVLEPPAPSAKLRDAIAAAAGQTAEDRAASVFEGPSATARPSEVHIERAADRSGPRSAQSDATATRGEGHERPGALRTQDAVERAPSPSDGARGPVVPLRGGARWLERAAALAMRREVAMAAVFLMALGVGVTTLYHPTRTPSVTESADRGAEIIPAVEVSADPASAPEQSARRRSASGPSGAEQDPRAHRAVERGEPRAARPSAATGPSSSAPPPSAPIHGAVPQSALNGVAIDSPRPLESDPTTEQARQQVVPQAAPRLPQQRVVYSNAGAELAGVAQQPASPAELSARGALERGDTSAALAQFRAALVAATDDVTRARLQREIATLEATQAAEASQAAQAAASASSSTAQVGSESSYRRPSRTRAPQQQVMPRAVNRGVQRAGAPDNANLMGY